MMIAQIGVAVFSILKKKLRTFSEKTELTEERIKDVHNRENIVDSKDSKAFFSLCRNHFLKRIILCIYAPESAPE
ncbi:MAG TPA: hypothetical protein DCO77_04340 [Nitrospiraceae bacterium]|nr:hypothetical protein [Nitrospiraceae bacterium]